MIFRRLFLLFAYLAAGGSSFGQTANCGFDIVKPLISISKRVKVDEHRYFLTFAARSGTPHEGGPAFVMWTNLGERRNEVEALGFYLTGGVGVFGPVPTELYSEFVKGGLTDSDVMLRIELSASEFEKSRKVWQTWEKRARTGTLLYSIPYLNSIVFFARVAESLNQCGERLKAHKLDWSVSDEIATKHNLPQIPLQYIKELRRLNNAQHTTDEMFP